MGYSVCPKCQRTMGKAFWEIFPTCPDCGMTWSTDPNERARATNRVVAYAVTCAILSFVPVAGAIFGLLGIFMGVVACRLGRFKVGLASAILAGAVGLGGQALFCWWGWGYFPERMCEARLQTLADSMYTYRALTGRYPPSVKALSDVRLNAPTECPFGGGAYLYRLPTVATTTSAPAGPATAASQPDAPRSSSQPATAPASLGGDDHTLIVAELNAVHPRRLVITSDLVVRALSHARFGELCGRPENQRFAGELQQAWQASTQPAKPAGQAATSTAPATGPTTASAPAG